MSFDRSSEEQEEHEEIVFKHYLKPVCVVGRGTFGRVDLCQHIHTERHYALKVMNIAKLVATRQVEHVHSEKRLLAKLKHPFIVKLLSTAKDATNIYMTLEFLPGGEIFSYLRATGAFPSPMAKFYAAEVVLALEYIHSFRIAYRDLKPENLMLTAEGHIKLTDFGFAKVIHTRSWTICGTAEYLAPEVLSGVGHNQSVDWWALGILIFELMSGKTPYNGGNADEIHENIFENPNITFPRKTFSTNAKEIVNALLKIEVPDRLGCRKAGSKEVRTHPWFSTINFDDLEALKVKPPLVPTIHHDGDIGNFDSYDDVEPEDDENVKASQRDLDLFEEW